MNTYYKNAKQKRTATVIGHFHGWNPLEMPAIASCDDTEQTLDITQALGMAPGVTAVYLQYVRFYRHCHIGQHDVA